MSYLLDKKIKRKKFLNIGLGVVFLIILFYFRAGVFNGLSNVSQILFRPVLIVGNSLGGKFRSLSAYFVSKNSLYLENENLKSQISESAADRANYISVVDENNKIKEILGRNVQSSTLNKMILGAILSKPNQSIYDTLIIDVGTKQGAKNGDTVFALGNIPIGRVDITYDNSSKVVLFSNPGEKTQVVVSTPSFSPPKGETNTPSPEGLSLGLGPKLRSGVREGSGGNVFMELVGRGGGNFEMILPRDFILQKWDQAVLPGLNPYLLAIVQTIISDPRDPFTKALLTSPVNVQELKFVEVAI